MVPVLNCYSDCKRKVARSILRNYEPLLLLLSFYSNKAYKYVRKVFINALPHPTTLRKWYQSVDGEPGFTSAALSALQMNAKVLWICRFGHRH
ncbi:hypothetical protein AVEN_34363-1 [Araneus ventricosus]|uniref:THAP9-like helix-turn-helix domain-containing protein n=1 Tax=Araneus ventricosus TaxID=182803 RepID=A0A4Y2G7Y2_ARAVE|nr:hypothetical protein AVEN_34363-1 [Araneus ventricosus]